MPYTALRNRILESRPDLPIEEVDKAYEFAKQWHEGQTRYSGEPYITHPVAATEILLALNPDLAAIQACLLHDVTEDTEATHEQVKEAFGEEVANLVLGMDKLAVVKVRKDASEKGSKWRDMFLAMSNDVRIVLIKLADRLHNMRTLDFVPEHKRERIAKESLLVHAAIASRLGIYGVKSELEDLCFKHLFPEDHAELAKLVQEYADRSEEYMAFATSQIEQLLVREGVKVEKVQGRMKHMWSLHQKMAKKEAPSLEGIYDLFAVRVILPDAGHGEEEQVSHLYSVLGLLHKEYLPLQDRFKDYVAMPKPNGYRSLHTAVLGLGGDLYEAPTEIQIRTSSMHKEAEIGVASHSTYKAGGSLPKVMDRRRHFALHNALRSVQAIVDANPEIAGMVKEWVEVYQHMHPEDRSAVEQLLKDKGMDQEALDHIRKGRSQEQLSLQPNVEEQLAWLRGLAEEEERGSELDLYPDKIFVLTPNRDVMELPKGSTPVDFAYLVHTEVGHRMLHAKVNGRIVPLDHQLHNGDLVEVGTRKEAKPNRYWISIAKTSSARAKIKNWFNKQDKEGNVAAGRDLLNEQLKLLEKPLLDEKLTLLKDYAGKSRSLPEREQLLESVGLGAMTATQMIKVLFPGESVYAKRNEPKVESAESTLKPHELSSKVLITGQEDLPVVLSACCKPKPPHPLIGYVTRGRTIRIHKQNCRELSGLEGERFISAHWKPEVDSSKAD